MISHIYEACPKSIQPFYINEKKRKEKKALVLFKVPPGDLTDLFQRPFHFSKQSHFSESPSAALFLISSTAFQHQF